MISGAGAMNPVCPREDGRLEWGNGVVSMLFDTAGDSPVRLCNVAGRGMGPIGGRVTDDGRTVLERDPRPIVEVRAANTGSQDNRLTLIATVAGSVLRFVSAAASEPEEGSAEPYRLEIVQFASYAELEPHGARSNRPPPNGPKPPRSLAGNRPPCRRHGWAGSHFRIRSVPGSVRSAHLHAVELRAPAAYRGGVVVESDGADARQLRQHRPFPRILGRLRVGGGKRLAQPSTARRVGAQSQSSHQSRPIQLAIRHELRLHMEHRRA